ncbi:hypothetical protein CJI97_003851 [Candidozyma auris]|nr:hypothetical protein CJI97_003851 [[Candida] auris]
MAEEVSRAHFLKNATTLISIFSSSELKFQYSSPPTHPPRSCAHRLATISKLTSPDLSKSTTMSTEEGKVIKTLEEDDEFEDFPKDSQWDNDTNPQLTAASLWEEDWDDDDAKDDFTERLREELKKAK